MPKVLKILRVLKANVMKYIILFFTITLLACSGINAQVVYEHVSNENIYEFLDEMANSKLIEINSAIKPYSRKLIADKLLEVKLKYENDNSVLNKRQLKELEFYLHGFQLETDNLLNFSKKTDLFGKSKTLATAINPLGIYYKDSVFTFSFKPVLGLQYWSNTNGLIYHRWNGFEGYAYIGKNFGAYGSLRDNHETEPLTLPEYFTQRRGVPAKGNPDGGVDYSESRGGIMYSWKWGAFGLIKDHAIWGSNYYGSNIFSGRTPSFAHIKLQLKPVHWFEFNYMHGWLVSEIIDSIRSYWDGTTYREVFHNKFIAANMFSFFPVKYLNISLGNSIVYSDLGVHAAYLIPFLFYKSVDHTLNGTSNYVGQNSQMFVDISSRNIKNLNLFISVFIDELSTYRFGKKNKHNFISYKGGLRLSNWPVQNLSLTGEYTFTLPMTYQHFISTTTFESNNYNLGHYMRDNSQDIFFSLKYKPLRGLMFEIFYNIAEHGNNYVYGEYPKPDEAPILESITWKKQISGLNAKYEIVNNAYLFLNVTFGNIKGYDVDNISAGEYLNMFTPDFFQGKTNTVSFGANVGF